MGLKESIYPHIDHSCEIVGNYSEAFLKCSYNDTEILNSLIKGTLDDEAKAVMASDPAHAQVQLGKFYREDGRYAEQLLYYVVYFGGWPSNWWEKYVPMDVAFERARADGYLK